MAVTAAGLRYPQWFLLLVAVLGILSGCRSSCDFQAFARRHHEALRGGQTGGVVEKSPFTTPQSVR